MRARLPSTSMMSRSSTPRGNLTNLIAIGSLFARGNATMEFDPMPGRDAIVQNLAIKRVEKANI